MKKFLLSIVYLISFHVNAQGEVSADWSLVVNENEITISIVEFNNFTVGLDGHWHYILNEDEYVAVHDINDVIISNLPNGEHTIHIWLVDHMHNAIDPPVEETITFNIDSSLSNTHYDLLDMRIYPNPVNDHYVKIISQTEGLKDIQIHTVTGKKVMDTTIDNSILDISSLARGFYIVKVTISGQSNVSKLVVK